jgi:hypothetical protein
MTAGDYEFRVTVMQNDVRCRWDSPTRKGQQMANARIHWEQHLDTILLLEEWLKRWDWIARREDSESLLVPETFKVLGDHLWKMALSEVPGTALINAINTVRDSLDQPKPTVRVHIGFTRDVADDLAALPWEFVHVSDPREFFLATEADLTLARYVEGSGLHGAIGQSPDDKLRVLFVASLPTDDHGNAYGDERAAIKKLSEDLIASRPSRIETKYYEGSDYERVAAMLRESRRQGNGGQIDVVHVAALFHRSRSQLQMNLPDNRGEWGWKKADSLVRALTRDRATQPKLVILHLCDWHEAPTDPDDLAEHFELLAPAFIRNGVSAVLAMQYPMRPTDVGEFLTQLYESLADGEPIGAAVQATRIDLERREGRYFGSPVLYMQSQVDASLVKRTAVVEKGETGADTERRPSSLRPSAPPVRNLDVELAEVVKRLDETPVRNSLLNWIEEENWPISVTEPRDSTTVETKISLEIREKNDSPEAVEILGLLRERVRELARPSGEW